MEKINLGVIFGGKSAEHEISIRSAISIIEALDRNKYAEWRNSGIVTDEVLQELMRRFK